MGKNRRLRIHFKNLVIEVDVLGVLRTSNKSLFVLIAVSWLLHYGIRLGKIIGTSFYSPHNTSLVGATDIYQASTNRHQ